MALARTAIVNSRPRRTTVSAGLPGTGKEWVNGRNTPLASGRSLAAPSLHTRWHDATTLDTQAHRTMCSSAVPASTFMPALLRIDPLFGCDPIDCATGGVESRLIETPSFVKRNNFLVVLAPITRAHSLNSTTTSTAV